MKRSKYSRIFHIVALHALENTAERVYMFWNILHGVIKCCRTYLREEMVLEYAA